MSQQLSVSMPERMIERVEEAAEEQYMNRSEFIRHAARQRIEEGE